jgi:hypothetical protein
LRARLIGHLHKRHNGYQQSQLALQTQQLRAQEKANTLMLLQQRLQTNTITHAQFEQERINIEKSYSMQTLIDSGAHFLRSLIS